MLEDKKHDLVLDKAPADVELNVGILEQGPELEDVDQVPGEKQKHSKSKHIRRNTRLRRDMSMS